MKPNAMNLTEDTDQFDANQKALTREITEAIRIKLIEAGMQGAEMENTTANIVFSIASILDDTTPIEADGQSVHPYLCFRTEDDDLLHCGENAYTYEFVTPVLKEMFEG